jgi:hypothetical protein
MPVNRPSTQQTYQPDTQNNTSGTEDNNAHPEQSGSLNAMANSDQRRESRIREGSSAYASLARRGSATQLRIPLTPERIAKREQKISNLRAEIHAKYERLEAIKAARAAETLLTSSEVLSQLVAAVEEGSEASLADQAQKTATHVLTDSELQSKVMADVAATPRGANTQIAHIQQAQWVAARNAKNLESEEARAQGE